MHKMTKYHNRKTAYDGLQFDSKAEAKRYKELKEKLESGEITELQRQVKYVLIPAQYGYKDGKRFCVEREVAYKADFVYKRDGETIVEDVKSPITRTKDYVIKRKLMLWVHNIHLVEVV